MAEKQISIRCQEFSKAVNYFYLHLPLKIDENIAAENQVKRSRDRIGFLSEIEPLKSNDPTKFLSSFYFALLGAEAFEQELPLVVNRHAGDSLGGPGAGRRMGQHLGREIRAENLDVPAGEWRKMRQQRHGKRIGFFASGTCCAPDAQRSAAFAGIS